MKIAINTRFLLPGPMEGLGRYTYEVARRLVQAHPEHEFLFFFDRPYDKRFLFDKNVQAVVLPPPARHPVLWYIWFEYSVRRALKKYQPDVFFSPDGYLSLRARTPTVMVVHDLAFEHFPEAIPFLVRHFYKFYSPRYCRRADHLLAVSEYTRKDIQKQYGIAEDRITTCGNGCRNGFSPLPETERQLARQQYAEGRPYFLYVGAVHPRKNTHRLIEAFSLFKQKTGAPIKLLLAGRFAWQTGPVKEAFEVSAFQKDIHFLGFVPDEELPRLMGAAFSFVYPSLFEGFGLPLLEAMHCDVPVISSLSSSLPEVAGDAALLVDPMNARQLADALRRLYEEEGLRQNLIEKGKKQRQKFSWDKTAEIAYRSLIEVGNKGTE
ncbi:MAG: glycosyltransferase family 4 protein [Lewinellaceae bacterium]|nr:glycosyltransferase family 4 protein [Lewinellaceae bacterium]